MEENKMTPRVINEVYQIIEMLPENEKQYIPRRFIDFFKNNAKDIDKYPVIKGKAIDEQDLDENTYTYVYMLLSYIKPELEYEILEPNWEKIDNIKEKVSQLENEIQTNLFNVNNKLADRELADKKFVLNLYYFGLTSDKDKQNKLIPFIALCKIFNIVYNTLREDEDLSKALEQYKYISNELKINIKKTF